MDRRGRVREHARENFHLRWLTSGRDRKAAERFAASPPRYGQCNRAQRIGRHRHAHARAVSGTDDATAEHGADRSAHDKIADAVSELHSNSDPHADTITERSANRGPHGNANGIVAWNANKSANNQLCVAVIRDAIARAHFSAEQVNAQPPSRVARD